MQEQRHERRRPRPIRSSMMRAAAALTASVLLVSACGGDSGGSGGGDTGFTLHALIVNASAADVIVSYEGADDVTLPTCSAVVHDFPLTDPFVVSLDGEVVLDSDRDLPDGLPNDGESDLIVGITIPKDGAATFDRVRPGSGLSKPGKASYCPSLPG